jgi:short-subunit dehydrogenase
VYISSRSADVCYKVAKELSEKGPGQCIAIPADLQHSKEIRRLVEEISKKEDRMYFDSIVVYIDYIVFNLFSPW